MPKISVIVPIYGVEKFLKEAVDSLLAQTLTDIEILLIDDGSKDNCPQMIDDYAKKDNRIVAIHKQNGGYGQTMNHGLKCAKGEYIAILEPDDYIKPNMYEDLYNIAKKFDSDIVKSAFVENIQSKQLEKMVEPKWSNEIPQDRSFKIEEYPEFLYYHPSVWSAIYKNDFLKENSISFVEAAGAGWTDNPFQVQTMCLANRINYTSESYYFWRRLNYYESDDLKNYTIPFKRSDEIHAWLENQGIKDKNILASLYKRELAYIGIVLGMKKIADKKDCFSLIEKMLDRMDKDIVFDKKYFSKKHLKDYKSFKTPSVTRIKLLFLRIKKAIIRVRLGRKSRYIVLFGKMIYGR